MKARWFLASNEDAVQALTGGGVTERCHLRPGRRYSPSQGSIEIASLELKTDRDAAQPETGRDGATAHSEAAQAEVKLFWCLCVPLSLVKEL